MLSVGMSAASNAVSRYVSCQ